MKRLNYLIILLFLVTFSCSSVPKDSVIKLNKIGQPLTQEQQLSIFNKNRGGLIPVTAIEGDAVTYLVVPRKASGKLSPDTHERVQSYLTQYIQGGLPDDYLAVIIYYPGKDQYNSSGTWTRERYALEYDQLEARLSKSGVSKVFYVFKDNEGLSRQSLNRDWIKDEDQLIEKTFFAYHYPSGSYTIVDHSGKYMSYFGEYSLQEVPDMIKAMKHK